MNYSKYSRRFTISIFCIGLILIAASSLVANPKFEYPEGAPFTPDPYANETKAERDARMAWFREARFGMFIHWGVYAVAGEQRNGGKNANLAAWWMHGYSMPVEKYKKFADEFNPTEYDPTFWAQLAKRAGMRYMVITSKHHDGFALFPSAVSDWDIADASPYGEDLIGPLADAARAEGIKFGLYYSHAEDWTHPGGGKALYLDRFKQRNDTFDPAIGPYWDEAQLGNFNDYLENIAVPQVGEILGRYQPDLLWWDIPKGVRKEHADRLISLLKIVPDIVHNNRLGGGYMGDIATAEQNVPPTAFVGNDLEVCVTLNDVWGYNRHNTNWKSTDTLIEMLCDIVGKGGNFLLNIGPKPDGTFPQPCIDRLEEMGVWMQVNSESIHGTSASPFYKLFWGTATQKAQGENTHVYLQVFDWPENGQLEVPGLHNKPASVQLLKGDQPLKSRHKNDTLYIDVPGQAPDPYVSVIKLEFEGQPEVTPNIPVLSATEATSIPAKFIDIHNHAIAPKDVPSQAFLKEGRITNWLLRKSNITWSMNVEKPGTYKVYLDLLAPEGNQIKLTTNPWEKGNEFKIAPTRDAGELVRTELGTYTFEKAGFQTLGVYPLNDTWKAMEAGTLTLVPVK
jgi:alpha-L-fucosidase